MSAVFGGIPAAAVELACREEVCVSEEVRREWMGLASRLEGKLTPDQLNSLKSLLLAVLADCRDFEIRKAVRICRDPADDAYLSLAQAARARILLTGDRDLLEIPRAALSAAGLQSLLILTPASYLRHTAR